MRIHHQLPVYSPVSLRGTLAAGVQALSIGSDPRPRLRELIALEFAASTVVLTASGTQALSLAISEALSRAGKDSLVALPAFSCFDVASAALGARARAVLYDVDPDTLAPNVSSLEKVINNGARVVVVAPLYGIPVDWNALARLAQRHDAILIEDAAQGSGASYNERPLGSLGGIAVLSFGRGKGWTGGNGGALLLDDRQRRSTIALADPEFITEAATAIGLAAQWSIGRPSIYGIPQALPMLQLGETVYHPPHRPRALGRAAAAAILTTYASTMMEAETRKKNAAQLLEAIAGIRGAQTIKVPAGGQAGYLRLPIRLSKGMQTFADAGEAESRGIASSYPMVLSELPQLGASLVDKTGPWPGAETLVRELVTLPTHSKLSDRDIHRIADSLRGLGR